MTLLQLRRLVSQWVDDVDNGYFLAANVDTYLNLAMKEVQKVLIQAFEDKWVKCVETTLVVNQQEYNLPSDFKKLNRLEIILSGDAIQNQVTTQLIKITRNQQNMISNANYNNGNPTAYFFTNDKLSLWPVPSTAKTLRMDYTYNIADMVNDSDEPDIPEEYQEYGAVIAAITCLTRDNRVSEMLLSKRAEYEKNLKRDAEQRNIDMPRTIVQTITDDTEFMW